MAYLKLILLLAGIIGCNPAQNNKDKMHRTFTQRDILDYLERYDQETYHFFIDFEHPYFFTAGSRLTLYADASRWAIVFEKSGYSTGNSCGEIEFDYFGNCLKNLTSQIPGDTTTSNMGHVILIDNKDLEQIEDGFELVAREKRNIKVRDTLLTIEQDQSKYLARGINPKHYNNPNKLIDFPSLIRYLDEENPTVFRATDKELRTCLPDDLPQLMQIDRWHHESYSHFKWMTSPTAFEDRTVGIKPSSYETYVMIADILVSRDTTKWKPTLKPNNDWRNWPNAGHM